MRKRLVAIFLSGCIALLVSGCAGFWDWLAGEPISQPLPEGEVAAGESGDGRPPAGESPSDPPPPGDPEGGPQDEPMGGDPDGGSPQPNGNEDESEPDPEPPPLEPFPQIQIRPVDESRLEESFARFRADLLRVLEARDVTGLLARVDANIQTSFGGEGGIEEFRARWNLAGNPEASAIWHELREILELGGVFTDAERTRFEAPYVSALYDADLDPFFFSVVTGGGVNVRAAPDLNAPAIGRVTYHVVRQLPADDEELPEVQLSGRTYSWARIQLPSGSVGYVVDRYLRSPLDYRAGFEKTEEGDWRMTYLLRGD